jgi:hypothetical protein
MGTKALGHKMNTWLNDISRDLNNKIYEKRRKSPGVVLRHQWHNEFINQGLDKKMSFQEYLKQKTKLWFKQKNRRK